MIAIHSNKVKSVQKTYRVKIEQQRLKAIKRLNKLSIKTPAGPDKVYVDSVIALFNANTDILNWDSEKILLEKNSLGLVPRISKTIRGKVVQVKSPIKNSILTALGYKNLRSSFYAEYFKKIGIKACVYCNSQLTLTVNKAKNVYVAKFDVDHFHSKDNFPFLSICLFNLYPACASCNRQKGIKVIEFDLYSDNVSKTKNSAYKFKLDSNSKAKYLTTKDPESIEFTFIEPDYSPNVQNFESVFHIQGIYQTQRDLIEELIIKSQIYNMAYLNTLAENFKKLNLHPELFKRSLVGNYTEQKDIHKRPMSKLVMDIAKELGLIK